jgi:hypothetical protein
MATENPTQIITKIADATVTNKRFVKPAAGGEVTPCGAGEAASGVVAMVSTGFTGTTIAAGAPVPVATPPGPVIVEAGAIVADAAIVMSDADGKAITFVDDNTNVALGEVVNGTSAGAAGDDLSIELYARGQYV